ncbi:hypothetical protein EDD86DRAFT_180756, partial [Gorgonomyces haynaldii]
QQYQQPYQDNYQQSYQQNYQNYAPEPYHEPLDVHVPNTASSLDPLTEKEPPMKKEPRCIYGCIPYKKRPRIICLVTTFVVLLAIGIVGFLFFPRYPAMKVLSLNLSDGVRSFKISGLENGPTKNFTVQLDMWMLVSVVNTNRYHMKVDSIDLKAFIVANTTQLNLGGGAGNVIPGSSPRRVFKDSEASVLIGTGNNTSILFPVNQNVTFAMNFTVIYRPDPSIQELKDDVLLNEIFQSCNIVQPGNRTMTVHYRALAPIKLLQPIGFTPTFEDDLKINCP